MALEIIFLVSGVCILILVVTKMQQLSTKRDPLLLRVISLGDEFTRTFSHRSAHWYADSKEKSAFFLKKQLPLRLRNLWNKSLTLTKEKSQLLANDIRTHWFKKDAGISEFFKSISEKESESESSDNTENRVE